MTQEKLDVLLRYPDAYSAYDTDRGTHKVYRRINGVAVAISGSWETASMAWHDAAKAIREREQPVSVLHEGDDGR